MLPQAVSDGDDLRSVLRVMGRVDQHDGWHIQRCYVYASPAHHERVGQSRCRVMFGEAVVRLGTVLGNLHHMLDTILTASSRQADYLASGVGVGVKRKPSSPCPLAVRRPPVVRRYSDQTERRTPMRRYLGLIPRDESFFELFERQAAVLRECLPILAAMRQADAVDPHWAIAMQTIEQRGDQLTSSIIRKAEQTFITPLDREDILALTVAMDDVLDFIEEFTIKLVDYRLTPDEALKAFLDLVSMAVSYTADGIMLLRDLKSLEELRAQMKACEHRADDLERAIIKESYELPIAEIANQRETKAITADDLQRVFMLYTDKRKRREIAELSEASVDACERVFHVLRNVYLKEL
jgi:uncharacterized protein